jgi:hypothetical protein
MTEKEQRAVLEGIARDEGLGREAIQICNMCMSRCFGSAGDCNPNCNPTTHNEAIRNVTTQGPWTGNLCSQAETPRRDDMGCNGLARR